MCVCYSVVLSIFILHILKKQKKLNFGVNLIFFGCLEKIGPIGLIVILVVEFCRIFLGQLELFERFVRPILTRRCLSNGLVLEVIVILVNIRNYFFFLFLI